MRACGRVCARAPGLTPGAVTSRCSASTAPWRTICGAAGARRSDVSVCGGEGRAERRAGESRRHTQALWCVCQGCAPAAPARHPCPPACTGRCGGRAGVCGGGAASAHAQRAFPPARAFCKTKNSGGRRACGAHRTARATSGPAPPPVSAATSSGIWFLAASGSRACPAAPHTSAHDAKNTPRKHARHNARRTARTALTQPPMHAPPLTPPPPRRRRRTPWRRRAARGRRSA
jgi:hypothetical protein